MSLKRRILWCLVGLLSCVALMGIAALLTDLNSRLFELTIIVGVMVAVFSLSAITAAFLFERRTWRHAMVVAVVASVVAILFLGIAAYLEAFRYGRGTWLLFQIGFIAAFWAYALPQAALLSLTSFPPGLYTRLRQATILVAMVMPVLGTVAMALELEDDSTARVLGVVGILDALGTLAVPVLYRIHGLEKDEGVQSTKLEIRLTCPRCLLEQTLPTGPGRCARCRLKIEVKIEEPRCPKCDYLLHHLTAPVCPECGAALSLEELPAEATSATQA